MSDPKDEESEKHDETGRESGGTVSADEVAQAIPDDGFDPKTEQALERSLAVQGEREEGKDEEE